MDLVTYSHTHTLTDMEVEATELVKNTSHIDESRTRHMNESRTRHTNESRTRHMNESRTRHIDESRTRHMTRSQNTHRQEKKERKYVSNFAPKLSHELDV